MSIRLANQGDTRMAIVERRASVQRLPCTTTCRLEMEWARFHQSGWEVVCDAESRGGTADADFASTTAHSFTCILTARQTGRLRQGDDDAVQVCHGICVPANTDSHCAWGTVTHNAAE